MELNLIALAIPVFLVAIGVELLVARWQGRALFRFNDAVTDLSCGIGNQAWSVFNKIALLALYEWVYQHGLKVPLPAWAQWVLAVLAIDFTYYWWHRASHRVNALWAAHVVHHQSEDYNLAVALRQAWFTSYGLALFHVPLALFGLPTPIVAIADALNTLYQFWIHTQTVGRLGPLEWVLNTPSHHRVHHGINPRYIDKNYAGMLIVWDRMFGTFAEEREEVVYGTVTGYRSWNALWANFEVWAKILELARRARGLDRLRAFVAPPEWTPEGPVHIPDVEPRRPKWDTPTPAAVQRYVLVHLATAILAIVVMLALEESAPGAALLALGLAILATLQSFAGLLEARPWATAWELGRLAAVAGVALWLAPPVVSAAVAAFAVGSAAAALALRPAALARAV